MTTYEDDKMFKASLRVRNTFYELYASESEIRRSKSEPALCCVSDSFDTARVSSTPGLVVSQSHTSSVPAVAAAVSSDGHEGIRPSTSLTEQHSMKEALKLAPCDTTIMVRNLPCRVGHDRMMAELKSNGLDGSYDFIYCPKSARDRKTFQGYCFINFMDPEAVEQFLTRFANYQFEGTCSEKVVQFDRAHVQGREANMALLRSSRNRVEFKSNPAGLRAA
eukprot:TRINITY_DN21315_c0_g1_i1.p1 TRINITY_DN21315_c0_g1~~TRINITY_DN21315_c0_g1_i1.p1  ORF type:complete len:221 (-),score=25.35 TRINITY_DN21315_c0_g1_i1:144-806(-)